LPLGNAGRLSPLAGASAGLAPLAGWSDAPFRLLCFEYGADFALTEMVSADGLVRDSGKTAALLARLPGERTLGAQIFGSDPSVMAEAAGMAEEAGPDFIDLNFGCPVKKVVRRNGGAAVMRDLDLLGAICSRVVESVKIPVTAKIRSGWSREEENYIEAGLAAQEAGVSAVTLHPRPRSLGFGGGADWTQIARLRECLRVQVIANGDVLSAADHAEITRVTGCGTVMIGRGAMGRPWIFEEIREVKPRERIEAIRSLLRMEMRRKGERLAVLEMRKQYRWFLRSLPGARDYRSRLVQAPGTGDVLEILDEMEQEL